MSKDKTERRVPNLRFKGFTDDWMQYKLEDLASNFDYGLNAAAKNYDGINKYLRITDIDEDTRIFKTNDIKSPSGKLEGKNSYLLSQNDIVFARTGASVGKTYLYNCSDGKVYFAGYLIRIRVNNFNSPEFIFYNTLTAKYQNFVQITSVRSGQPGINSEEYKKYKINIPNLDEQKLIGNLLIRLDEIIALEQEKLRLILEMKHAFLRKIYSTRANDNMVLCKLNNYISKKGKINKENKEYIVSSVNNKKGFINQSEQFESTRLNNLDKSTYRIIESKDFAYNPSRINVGSIGYNDTDNTLIVSPLYIAFRLNDEINDRYFYYYTQTENFFNEVNRNTEGSVRQSLTFENLGNINIPIPSNYQIQLSISQYFKKIDNIIFITEQKINRYKKIKTYLLQNLFV